MTRQWLVTRGLEARDGLVGRRTGVGDDLVDRLDRDALAERAAWRPRRRCPRQSGSANFVAMLMAVFGAAFARRPTCCSCLPVSMIMPSVRRFEFARTAFFEFSLARNCSLMSCRRLRPARAAPPPSRGCCRARGLGVARGPWRAARSRPRGERRDVGGGVGARLVDGLALGVADQLLERLPASAAGPGSALSPALILSVVNWRTCCWRCARSWSCWFSA